MRPAQKEPATALGSSESRLTSTSEAAPFRASEPGPSTATVSPKPIRFAASFQFPQGERYIYMSMKLYVGNLSFQTDGEQLQQLFSQAGTVQSAMVVEDRQTGKSRGFGFVEMSSKEEGTAAIAQFNGKELNGRNLNVNEAKPRENRNFGGGNRGGGYGGNGGGRRDFDGRNDRTPRW